MESRHRRSRSPARGRHGDRDRDSGKGHRSSKSRSTTDKHRDSERHHRHPSTSKDKTESSRVADGDDGSLPAGVAPITQDDYFKLNAPFRLWLRKEKDRYFDEMPTDKARRYFASFVRAWNEGRLRSRYYKQDAELTNLSKRVVTRHRWGFVGNVNKSELEEVKEDIHASTSATAAAAGSHSGRVSTDTGKRQQQGPTMPSRSELPPESGRLFDEEQRARDRYRHKRERREAKEREELILDEIAPKETGREAKLAKKRALNQHRHAEKSLDVEIPDDAIFGSGGDDFRALLREREMVEKRKQERREARRSEADRESRLAQRAEKERSTIEMFRAMAEQSRAQGLGMQKPPPPP